MGKGKDAATGTNGNGENGSVPGVALPTRVRRTRATIDREEDFETVNVRFPKEIGARLDAFVEQLRVQAPWANPSRADAVRALIMAGLPKHVAAPASVPVVSTSELT